MYAKRFVGFSLKHSLILNHQIFARILFENYLKFFSFDLEKEMFDGCQHSFGKLNVNIEHQSEITIKIEEFPENRHHH